VEIVQSAEVGAQIELLAVEAIGLLTGARDRQRVDALAAHIHA
jgi:hypothetical protein